MKGVLKIKKLTTPEMNVIRFNEADVIVASGGDPKRTINVSGIKDGTLGNGKITYMGTDYTNNNQWVALQNAFAANISSSKQGYLDFSVNNTTTGLNCVWDSDESTDYFSDGDYNGNWTYDSGANGGAGAFVKQ